MKFLIYFGCFFVLAIVRTLISDAGIILGGIPTGLLAVLTYWIAKKLCGRWDVHCRKTNIKKIESRAAAAGKSRKEFLIEHTPAFIIDICEEQCKSNNLREALKPHIKAKLITPMIADALVAEFSSQQS